MSSRLEWFPAEQRGKGLGDPLKHCLRKNFGDPVDVIMSAEDIPYLLGLSHAGIENAMDLVSAIRKHDHVRVKEVY